MSGEDTADDPAWWDLTRVLQLELGRNHTLDGLLKNEEEVYLPGSLMSPFFTGQISPFRSLTLVLGLFHPGLSGFSRR